MSDEKINLDILKDYDNEAVLELSHQCPQDGMIKVYPDRSPEFRRLHKQLSDKSYHIVARKGNSLIASFGAIYTNLYYKNILYDSAFLLDLKVHPEHRRSTIAYRVVKETVRYLREENETTFAVATFLKGNEYSLIFTKSRAGVPHAEHLGDFRLFSIVPMYKLRVSKQFDIGHPTEQDIPELVKLYNKFYSTYKLAPRMTEDLFRFYCNEIEGMGIEQFWVARKDGEIKAVICAWKENKYKRWFVNRMSKTMKIFSFPIKYLGYLFKMPSPIKEGTTIKHISLVMSAHDDSIDGMKNLLRSINNFYRGKKYTSLQTHFNDKDPTNAALKGLTGFTVLTEAHAFTEDPQLAKDIANDDALVHFEWPMFI